MRLPLLAPLAAVSSGVFAARFAPFPFAETFGAALLLALLAVLGLSARDTRPGRAACWLALALAAAAGAGLSGQPPADRVDLALSPADLETPVRLSGWVRRPPEPLFLADRFELEVERVLDGRPASGGVAVIVHRRAGDAPLSLSYGARVEFLARTRRLRNYNNPGAFDRIGYLQRKGIYLKASVRPGTPILLTASSGPPSIGQAMRGVLWSLRSQARSRFDQLAAATGREQSDKTTAIVRAMILGDRRGLDVSTRSLFETTGAYHVLVVSGLHVGLLAAMAMALFRFMGAPRWLGAVAGLAPAVGYALLLEAALPVSRAAWMLAACLAAAALYRARNLLNVVAGTALAFLAWDPTLLVDAGFQLSFLSVAAIAGLALPLLERGLLPWRRAVSDIDNLEFDIHLPVEAAARRVALRGWLEPIGRLLRLRSSTTAAILLGPLRVGLAAAGVMLLSLILTLALAAPLAWHFQRLALASPLANAAATPLLSVIAPSGLLALATGWQPPFELALGAAGLLESWLDWTAHLLPGLERRVPPPPAALAAAALASCALWAWCLVQRGPRSRTAGAVCAVATFGLIAVHPFEPRLKAGVFEMSVLDVGQGEALLLAFPNGGVGLIDAGGLPDFDGDGMIEFDIGERVVSPYLWSRSIRRLEFLAVTHPDADHLGGAYAVARNFRPQRLWLPAGDFGGAFDSLIGLVRGQGGRVERLGAGRSRMIGGVEMHALPSAGPLAKLNDRSLALLARFGAHEFLLTGDLENAGEQAVAQSLRPLRGEVLKVAHHGSRSSSSPELLDRFRPAWAVISAGPDNLYSHPHRQVLSRLAQRGIHVLRTDTSGLISISTDGRRLAVETHRSRSRR